MSLAFDESGRPFIILREQAKKKRVKGLEAHKVSIAYSSRVAKFRDFILNEIMKNVDQYLSCKNRSQFDEDITWSKRYG